MDCNLEETGVYRSFRTASLNPPIHCLVTEALGSGLCVWMDNHRSKLISRNLPFKGAKIYTQLWFVNKTLTNQMMAKPVTYRWTNSSARIMWATENRSTHFPEKPCKRNLCFGYYFGFQFCLSRVTLVGIIFRQTVHNSGLLTGNTVRVNIPLLITSCTSLSREIICCVCEQIKFKPLTSSLAAIIWANRTGMCK